MRTHSYLLGALVVLIATLAIGYTGYLAMRSGQEAPSAPTTTTTEESPAPVTETAPSPAPEMIARIPDPTLSEDLTNKKLKSPIKLSGSAVGNWYFEASFPVVLIDASGNVLAQAPAKAQGDWMTTTTVPFLVDLSWATTTATSGVLILRKDNPSGDPARDQELKIPVSL